MNYQETLEWMFAQLPMFQRVGALAFKKDLTNSLALSKKDFAQILGEICLVEVTSFF